MRRWSAALLILAMILLAGCGVRTEQDPTAIDITPPTAPAQPPPEEGPLTVTVYFLRGDRLEAVERAVAERNAETLLATLTTGPTRREVTTGLRTALTPQPLTLTTNEEAPGTGDVSVTSEFTSITGESQLLAVAQLVWTVTELPGISRVRLSSVEGETLEVPTDRGLSRGPVGREDYMSVEPSAPEEELSSSPPVPSDSAEPPDPSGSATPSADA